MSIDATPANARPSLHTRSANAAKRKRKDRMMTGLLIFCVTLVLIPIALILYQVVQRGIGAMSWEFLSKVQPFVQRREGGGYLNGLFGTLYLLVIAVTVAVPLGIATATFIVEYKDSKLSPVIRFFTDVMSGVPSIFIGLYIYALLVQGRIGFSIGFSTLAGGLALSLLMLPIVARGFRGGAASGPGRSPQRRVRFGGTTMASGHQDGATGRVERSHHGIDAGRGSSRRRDRTAPSHRIGGICRNTGAGERPPVGVAPPHIQRSTRAIRRGARQSLGGGTRAHAAGPHPHHRRSSGEPEPRHGAVAMSTADWKRAHARRTEHYEGYGAGRDDDR